MLRMLKTLLLAVSFLAGVVQNRTPDFDAISARVDPYVEKNRVVVLTDIANEPDDQMSMVRFLLYSNELDVEGLVAGTSTWMRNRVRPDVIATLIDAYAQVRPNLRETRARLSGSRGAARPRRKRPDLVRHGAVWAPTR